MGAIIKLAQPGFNVETAGDENLIYSSEWPLLKIAKQGSFKFSNVEKPTVLVKHDLGFPPMFWYYANTPLFAWQVVGAPGQERRSEFMGPVGDGKVVSDSTNLSWSPVAFPAASGKSQLYFYVFALDLTKQYNAPIIKVGALVGGRDGEGVFKVAKPTKDTASSDLSDFIMHSRARSPLIHSVNPSPGVVTSFVVNHKLGYNPMFFAFTKNSAGQYVNLYTGQGASSSLLSNEQNITFADTGGQEITIVVLKDPFIIDYSLRVSV